MKINSHRLLAFTIMEVTIAMLISAIVIGITYTAYQIISKSYFNFNSKNSNMAVMLRVDKLLKKDFSRADNIIFAENNLTFKDSSQLIKYHFEPNYIIRYSAITDTFKVRNIKFTPLFENSVISEGYSYADKQPSLDEFSFSMILNQDTVICNYLKTYSSQQLIKLTANAGN